MFLEDVDVALVNWIDECEDIVKNTVGVGTSNASISTWIVSFFNNI